MFYSLSKWRFLSSFNGHILGPLHYLDYWTSNDSHIISTQSNLFHTHDAFLISVVGATPNHIPMSGANFWTKSIKILIFLSSTNYMMLRSFNLSSLINVKYIPQIPLKQLEFFLKSWTSTGYFSNSASSSITRSFSPTIHCHIRNLQM